MFYAAITINRPLLLALEDITQKIKKFELKIATDHWFIETT